VASISQALSNRDSDQAEALMYDQILRSKERVLEALTRRLGVLGQAVPLNLQSAT
jgi:DNA-binding GntR family transcriptional regulator